MQTIEVLCLCAMNLLALVIGVKIGQKTSKGEEIKTPKISALNPLKMYEEHKEKEAVKQEMDKLEVILNNIEKYDGTEKGQEDVPK
jgi:hypothetical protein